MSLISVFENKHFYCILCSLNSCNRWYCIRSIIPSAFNFTVLTMKVTLSDGKGEYTSKLVFRPLKAGYLGHVSGISQVCD